ncbi:hypothetical protein C8Q79DRAFT_1103573 [Trametes meyenii]|nr:hypothetical protein C8Q79DRAFT_1103573 [Trametes meyenii]
MTVSLCSEPRRRPPPHRCQSSFACANCSCWLSKSCCRVSSSLPFFVMAVAPKVRP